MACRFRPSSREFFPVLNSSQFRRHFSEASHLFLFSTQKNSENNRLSIAMIRKEFLTCGQDMIGSCSPDSERYPLSAHRHTALTDNTSRTRGERMLRPGDIYLGLLSRQMFRQTPRNSAPAVTPLPPKQNIMKESRKNEWGKKSENFIN